ncbi:MAG: hypothetical protein Q8P00_06975, partial [Dehalococcoidia bacterium]|nr:hypothetical protein [Dehalococcoidia bacterium]
ADGWPLFALPLAGDSPAEVSEKVLLNRDFLSWAPTGHSLALIEGGYRSTWYRKHLAVSDLSGLAQLRSEPSRADLFPAWSPDSRYIAYTSAPEVQTDGGNEAKEAGARRKIWVVQPDGSGRRQLTSDSSYRDERAQWSRDGAFILFGRFYQNEQMQVWLMRADGSDLRPVVDELTPTPGPASAWFGYYGAVGWGSLYDWWQGSPTPGQASTATASPKAGPLPTPTGATTLSEGPKSGPTIAAGDLSAFLQAAAVYLEARETLAQPEAVVSVALQNLARSKGISPTYVKRSEGEPEGWIGASADGAFLLWRQGDKAFYQTWGRGEGDLFSFLVNLAIAFRLVERSGSLEMGFIPANFGSTADAWFLLLRLADGRWQQVWSPLPAARDSWASGGGKVEFVGQGIDAFRLVGPIPRDVSGSRVFDEFGVFLKQQYESEWRRQGDAYVRVTGHIVPTPMTALASFIDSLQRGDKAAAARFAVDAQTAEHALGMKLNMPAGGSGWIGGRQTEEGAEVHIRFFDPERRQRSFIATLVEQAGEWRVRAIEQIPPAPDPGVATSPQSGASR